MIHPDRIKSLNQSGIRKGRFVLYWMQASQRTLDNHALEYAAALANEQGLPLLTFFGLTPGYPGANLRHYAFMLEGVREVKRSLKERGVAFAVRTGNPVEELVTLAREAACVVTDRGYTKIQKRWRADAAKRIECRFIQVESDVIVPVEEAYPKEAYSAGILRPKIQLMLGTYLRAPEKVPLEKDSLGLRISSEILAPGEKILRTLDLDRSVVPVEGLRGGTGEALKRLERFVKERLDRYPEERNNPIREATSEVSPYLHFGQISPLTVALQARERGGDGAGAFLEELIVRRELAINFVHYNPDYDNFGCLPAWCVETLKKHQRDPREYLYTVKELEAAETHDPYWNAAQREMVRTGRMHGYMRMYWGKKILEWSPTPEEAYRTALYLNDRYEMDGRDPNGFAGVAWCFGKHDRGWGERPVFGKIRYMNARGLRRKFDADAYARKHRGQKNRDPDFASTKLRPGKQA